MKKQRILFITSIIIFSVAAFTIAAEKKPITMSDALSSQISAERYDFFVQLAKDDRRFFDELRGKNLNLGQEDKLLGDYWKKRADRVNQFRANASKKRSELAKLKQQKR
jgi:hypothetical protein